jgi:hypothetical protein
VQLETIGIGDNQKQPKRNPKQRGDDRPREALAKQHQHDPGDEDQDGDLVGERRKISAR